MDNDDAQTNPVSPRVLIVDDNQSAANALTILIRHHGYTVRTAYDGETALRLMDSFKPHIILLDIGLPDRDGYTLAPEFRKKAAQTTEPFLLIAVSGYGQATDKEHAVEVGFDLHLVKPVGLATIIECFDLLKNKN